MYGLMTEEINHSYDGGLLAELIQNRTFQDPSPRPRRGQPAADAPASGVPHWSVVGNAGGKVELDRANPVDPALPASVKLTMTGRFAGVQNDGYWGVPIRPNTTYTASFYAKGGDGFAGPVTASLVLDDGPRDGNAQVAYASTPAVTGQWQKYTLTLKTGPAAPTTARAQFVVGADGTGTVRLSCVSLFPPTYMDKPAGLRPDLMRLMADLHPAFIRLPGGNYLEGDTFPTRFDWKKMIGPADQRPGHMGCWSYRSSDGFGLPEYLTWCEQLHAEPVLAVFAGYTLNHDHVAAGPALQPYVDEALEEIEYVSGPADSPWGQRRAADGHPEPFKLHYVEVGNEDTFDRSGGYAGRYGQFYDAIKAKYPDLKIIATAPVRGHKMDVLDDHYYMSARQMTAQADKYAKANRGGPEIFVGEWATQEGRPTPDLNAGLADAAWLMGMERSADVVRMTCYAPLLVNVNPGAWQWPTNLIGYDAMTSFGSPSYYAQAMIMRNRGDVTVPVAVAADPQMAAAEPSPRGGVGVGVWHTDAEYKDVHVVVGDQTTDVTDQLVGRANGANVTGGRWNLADGAVKPAAANSTSWVVAPKAGRLELHAHAQGPQGGRRRGVPDPLPRDRRRELLLVEPGRVGQHPDPVRGDARGQPDGVRPRGELPRRGQPLVRPAAGDRRPARQGVRRRQAGDRRRGGAVGREDGIVRHGEPDDGDRRGRRQGRQPRRRAGRGDGERGRRDGRADRYGDRAGGQPQGPEHGRRAAEGGAEGGAAERGQGDFQADVPAALVHGAKGEGALMAGVGSNGR